MKKTIVILATLFMLITTVSTSSGFLPNFRNLKRLKPPSIKVDKIIWDYKNKTTKQNKCRDKCAEKWLGKCVRYKKVCNNRTKIIAAFNKNHKRVVKSAMSHIQNQMGRSAVRSCIDKHVKRYKGISKKQARDDLNALINASRWPRINLHPFNENTNTNGWAYLERKAWEKNGKLGWKNRININLNLTAIDKKINNGYGITKAGKALSGTIFHELLHQMGHSHPDTDSYKKNYESGYFVVVAGDCIMYSGAGDRNTAKGLSLAGGQLPPPGRD